MKYLTKLVWMALAVVSLAVSAGPVTTIDGITVSSNGSVIETGPAYLSTDTGNFNVGSQLQVIGKITSIADNATSLVTWQDGDNGKELDFLAHGFTVIQNMTIGTTRFLAFSGGSVDFYTNADGALTVTSGPAAALASILGGNLWLSSTGTDVGGVTTTSFNSTVGQKLGNGQGYLDVTGGLAQSLFDTNTFDSGNGGAFSDISWFVSFGVRDTTPSGFTSDGGVTVLGLSQTNQLPEPAPLGLMGAGLLAVYTRTRKSGV